MVDPHVEISVSSNQIRVGDHLTVIGRAFDIGLPHYTLLVDRAPIMTVAYTGEAIETGDPTADPAGLPFIVHSYGVTAGEVQFELEAIRAGAATVSIAVTGEIHYGYPGPATWGGGSSKALEVTVSVP